MDIIDLLFGKAMPPIPSALTSFRFVDASLIEIYRSREGKTFLNGTNTILCSEIFYFLLLIHLLFLAFKLRL